MQRLLFTFFAVFTAFSLLQSQSIHEDYFDGRLYVSFERNCQTDIHTGFMNSRAAELEVSQQDVFQLFDKYGVELIEDYFKLLNDPRFDKVYEIYFSKYELVNDFIRELEGMTCVLYAEMVPIMYSSTYVPTDPRIADQWTLAAVQAYDAWNIHRDPTREVVIAIIDDAVRIDHEDLQPNLWVNTGEIPNNGIDDDGNGYIDDVHGFDVFHNRPDPSPPAFNLFSHGTHCAGIASAATDNFIGIASLGYNCKIMSIKAKRDNNTSNTIDNTTAGIVYAVVNRPDVISMSFGGGGGGNTIQNIFDLAFERGILCLSSAGNSNTNLEAYPAAYRNVFAVASTAPGNRKSGFSNFGEWIDISAPGSGILSSVAATTSSYEFFSGTSMACPNAAGLAGYLFGYHPNVTLQDVIECMMGTADNLDEFNPGFEGQLGTGQINALKAIECLALRPPTPRMGYPRVQYVGAEVLFEDKSLNGSFSRWSLNGESIANEASFSFTFDQPGTFAVRLEVEEGYLIDDVIHILPQLMAPYTKDTEGFAGDFETDPGHFAAFTPMGTQLKRSVSEQPLKNGTNSGEYAFVLGPDVPFYEQETRAYLYTPMFKFEDVAMYELSFFAKYEINTGLDGFQVEYSEDGGRNWEVLGTERSDWYNFTNRSLGIGAFQLGESYFTGRQSTFRRFRWNVSSFVGKSISFRIAFKSQERGLASGFAIDDFMITKSDDAPLTVVRNFEGDFNNERRIELSWTTRPEYFCRGFWLESSRDGRTWVQENFIPARNFDIELNTYNWESLNIRTRDLHFFRLFVVNRDDEGLYDESFYTDPIVVRKNLAGIELFNASPNPFNDHVHLVFTDILTTDLEYTLFDISGKAIFDGKQAAGQGFYQVNIPDVPPGMYTLFVRYDDTTSGNTSIKLVKN